MGTDSSPGADELEDRGSAPNCSSLILRCMDDREPEELLSSAALAPGGCGWAVDEPGLAEADGEWCVRMSVSAGGGTVSRRLCRVDVSQRRC